MNPVASLARTIDRRAGSGGMRASVWPVGRSQLLGHLALLCFVLLTVSGLYLAFPYEPSVEPVTYRGSSELYHGVELPRAFASIVRISEDLPIGMSVRRLHEATAHLLTAVVALHLMRVLLTGAFRRPRAGNHLVGVGLLVLVLVLGWSGENLPYGLLAGTSLRIGFSILHSVPYIGEPLALLAFGGEYPTALILPRLFWLHVLVLPAAFATGTFLHVWLYRRHSPASYRGRGSRRRVRGVRLWPDLAGRLAVLALAVTAVLVASTALVPWSDVELEGPYRIAETGNTLQPPWYLFFPEGGMRVLPAIDVALPGGGRITNVFVAGALLPAVLIALIALMPWIDRWLGGGAGDHHLLDGAGEVPGRLAFVGAVTGVAAVLSVSAASDVIAHALRVPVESVILTLRTLLVLVPVAAGGAAWALARRRSAAP